MRGRDHIVEENRKGIPIAAFATITCLFFAWGFITSNNDPLIAALKGIYHLPYFEAFLIQSSFFAAYFFVSLPSAALLNRLGNSWTIIAALALMVGGCLVMLGASALQSYALSLLALFVLASGITALQVAANPLAAALGPQESSHFRLTFAQAFNSLGVVLGVHIGSKLMLSGDIFEGGADKVADNPAARAVALAAVDHAFIIIALSITALMALIFVQRRRIEAAAPPLGGASSSVLSALRSRWALWGALAIFLYVGAEVAIGSVMINFLNQSDVMGLALEDAGWYLGWIYWFGALVGRFIGSALLTRFSASRLLAIAATAAALLSFVAFTVNGPLGAWAALSVGLFNSIMFPTIFTLTLERSEAPASATSGLLCVAIVGGAALPPIAGWLADRAGVNWAFIVPALGYVGIILFAIAAHRAKALGVDPKVARATVH
jgi:MFS transporter, FHS family, L-fucose permease